MDELSWDQALEKAFGVDIADIDDSLNKILGGTTYEPDIEGEIKQDSICSIIPMGIGPRERRFVLARLAKDLSTTEIVLHLGFAQDSREKYIKFDQMVKSLAIQLFRQVFKNDMDNLKRLADSPKNDDGTINNLGLLEVAFKNLKKSEIVHVFFHDVSMGVYSGYNHLITVLDEIFATADYDDNRNPDAQRACWKVYITQSPHLEQIYLRYHQNEIQKSKHHGQQRLINPTKGTSKAAIDHNSWHIYERPSSDICSLLWPKDPLGDEPADLKPLEALQDKLDCYYGESFISFCSAFNIPELSKSACLRDKNEQPINEEEFEKNSNDGFTLYKSRKANVSETFEARKDQSLWKFAKLINDCAYQYKWVIYVMSLASEPQVYNVVAVQLARLIYRYQDTTEQELIDALGIIDDERNTLLGNLARLIQLPKSLEFLVIFFWCDKENLDIIINVLFELEVFWGKENKFHIKFVLAGEYSGRIYSFAKRENSGRLAKRNFWLL